MPLSNDLISQFAKITKDDKKTDDPLLYGAVDKVELDGKYYVKIDGSDVLTPVISTTDLKEGDRVTVTIKNHTAVATGSTSAPSARTVDVKNISDSLKNIEAETAKIKSIEADNVVINGKLTAVEGDIDTLKADNVIINNKLTASEADIKKLQTDKLDASYADIVNGNITNLDSKYATIESLDATNATINNLGSTYATITELNAAKGEISDLKSNVADIDTLMFGSASGDTIQTSFSNSVIAQLGNAQIKSAMIESVSASKITAGDIITNNVRVLSEDGRLLISDETIQISDDTRVRVQIGKDAANDYSINVWDQNGNLMFSKGGITDSAIKEAIIRNDMVSDTANIAAHKLDIDSLFEEINGSSKTIKSSKVLLDEENQTLDVAFTSLTTDVEGLQNDVSSQGTQITAIQGQISSKVWQQDIDTATDNMSTQYSTLDQKVDGISTTVASHSSQIASKADSSTVTTVNNKVASLEQNLNGFKTTVSDTYTTKTEFDNLVIGGRNILQQSGHWTELPTWWVSNGGGISLDTTNTYLGYNTLATSIGSGIAGNNFKFLILDTDKVYTYSAIIKSDKDYPGGHAVPLHYHCSTDGTTNDKSVEVIEYDQSLVAGEWKLVYLTFKPLGKYFRPFIYIGSSGDNVCNCNIAYIKLEEGNKPTDWSPAPEDMASTLQMNSAIEQKADSITATVQKTITSATQYSLKKATVDLSGDEYDENMYYPVAGSGIPSDGYKTFQVNVQLNSYTTPSWSTHTAGFTCNLSARMKAFGWGTAFKNLGWIDDFSFCHCTEMPAYLWQMTNASVPVFYLRGGGRYYLYTDYECMWTPHPSGYTVAEQTVSPTENPSNYSGLVDNWTDHNDLVSAKSSITQLSDRITTNVTETTNLGTRMSTVEQTAEGLTVKIDGLEIGGRNLYVNSATFDSDKWINTAGWTKDGVDSNGNVRIKCGTWAGLYQFIEAKAGETYTLSANVLGDGVSDFRFYASLYDTPSVNGNVITGVSPAASDRGLAPTTEQRFHQTITVTTDGYLRIRIENANSGSYIWVSSLKLEKGNKATDWTPAPEDMATETNLTAVENRVSTNENNIVTAQTTATNAAKTATNYLNFSSSGLVVGDMTSSTLGKNVRITSSNVDIRDGSTTLASFGANTIYLGKNSETAVINLCNGSATMKSVDDSNFQIYTDKRLVMKAYDSLLLDCWRDSTHQTRISMQSADPDNVATWGGISAWLYQDTIENSFDMSGNTTEFKIIKGTTESSFDLNETRLRVRANSTQIQCTNGLYVGNDGSYAAKITLGYKSLQDKSIRWYWSDNALHDVFSNSNGQITYVGPGDIDETTTTMIRGQYVRLYAHNGGAVYLGYSGSTAVTSDRNMKTDILDVDDKYMDFFDKLRPITYKYDCPGNKGHRDHVGFVAQEVEEALIESGLTTEQFAGLVIEKDISLNPNYDSNLSEDENTTNETHYDTLYSLRYEEFISLLVKKVQSLQEQINQLNANIQQEG